MRFDRTKNASRNIVFGVLQRIYQLIVPFIMRTAMIYYLGVEYLGLDGLFTSVLSVLNLAELGVGSAMVYSMYKPIAEDDRSTICALMNLYKRYYRLIGLVVLIGGLVLSPFLPELISGSVPKGISIYILFLLNLGATVLSYWLFAYKNCLLQAYQRSDVVSVVTMAVNTFRYVVQFLVLLIFQNYYYYLVVNLIAQIAVNIVTAVMAERLFPNLNATGELPKEIKRGINNKIKDLFTAKIGAVVVNSVDTLVISAFLGLEMLAIYQNYYYIVTALLSIVNIFVFSCMAGIGNSIVVESKAKNFNDLKTFTFIIAGIATFCSSSLLCLFQPFMKLWVGEQLMFGMPAVICFCVYFFIVQINTLLNMYKDAAGIWHEDRFRPLITAFVNLILNLLTVQFMGIYGILLSTVISMFVVGIPWLLHNLFALLFDIRELREYVICLLKYFVLAVVSSAVSYWVSGFAADVGIGGLIIKGVICGFVTLVIYLISFGKSTELRNANTILNNITKGKLHIKNKVKRG